MIKEKVFLCLAILSIILILIFVLINRLRKESFVYEVKMTKDQAQTYIKDFLKKSKELLVLLPRVPYGTTRKVIINQRLEDLIEFNKSYIKFMTPDQITEAGNLKKNLNSLLESSKVPLKNKWFDFAKKGKGVNREAINLDRAKREWVRGKAIRAGAAINCDPTKDMDVCCQKFVNDQTKFTNAQLDEYTGFCKLNNTQCPEV